MAQHPDPFQAGIDKALGKSPILEDDPTLPDPFQTGIDRALSDAPAQPPLPGSPMFRPRIEELEAQSRTLHGTAAAELEAMRPPRPEFPESMLPVLPRNPLGTGKQIDAITTKLRAALDENRSEAMVSHGERLGSRFVPDEGLSGLEGFFTGFDLSRSKDFDAMRKKFLDEFPSGDFELVRDGIGGTTILFNKGDGSDEGELRELNPRGLDIATTAELLGGLLNEQAALTLIGTGLAGPIGAGAGAFLGEMAQRGIETARGFEEGITTGDVVTAGVMGIAAGAGERAFGPGGSSMARRAAEQRGLIKSIDPRAEKGILALGETAEDVILAAERLGLRTPPIGVLARESLFRRGFKQLILLRAEIGEDFSAMLRGLETRLRATLKRAGGSFKSFSDVELLRFVQVERAKLSAAMTKLVEGGTLGKGGLLKLPEDASRAFRAAAKDWRKTTAGVRDEFYTRARASAVGVKLSVQDALSATQVFKSGKPFRLSNGDIVSLPVKVSGKLQSALDDLANLHPVVDDISLPEGVVRTSFEQVKEIRARFWDARTSLDGDERLIANEIWFLLKSAMDNPILPPKRTFGKGSRIFKQQEERAARFTRDYQEASQYNAFRERSLEREVMVAALDETKDPQVIAKFLKPGHTDDILFAKDITGNAWREVQAGFASRLHRIASDEGGAGRMLRELDTWRAEDPTGLRLLMTEKDEQALRSFATRNQIIDEGAPNKLLGQHLTEGERALKFMETASEREIRDFVAANGGINGSAAGDLRFALYFRLLRDAMRRSESTEVAPGAMLLDPVLLSKNADAAVTNPGFSAFLDRSDIAILKDVGTYATSLRVATDVGASMQAAQFGAAIVTPGGPVGMMRLLLTSKKVFGDARITAWLLSRRPTSRKLLKVPKGVRLPAQLKGLTAVLATALGQLARDPIPPEFQDPFGRIRGTKP